MGTFDWAYTLSLVGYQPFWEATLLVAVLATLAWATAVTTGMTVALGRESGLRSLGIPLKAYVWFFRSMPLLVLIVFVYNLPQLLPATHVVLNSPFWAGYLALVLSETAYISEIHRGGLNSVGPGQRDAARALGLRYRHMMSRVVIPQALRIAMPGLGNQYVYIIKLTSLVSVISLNEILLTGEQLYTQNFKVLETLVAVSFYYIVLVTVVNAIQQRVENRLEFTKHETSLVKRDEKSQVSPRVERTDRATHPHSGEVVIKARDVTKTFDNTRVLHGVSFDVHEGEVVALVGPSGSGKTTMLRSLNRLERVDSGVIEVCNEPMGYLRKSDGGLREVSDGVLARQRRKVGMVFQDFNLFPHLTVYGNLALAPKLTGKYSTPDGLEVKATELLRKVGMDEHLNRYPHQLSGGQKQRVAIARALTMNPKAMLFDEPTSALDPEMIGEVLQVMSDLAEDGMTMVLVTHEVQFVEGVADWLVFVDHGQLVEQGRPSEVINNPSTQRARDFFRD